MPEPEFTTAIIAMAARPYHGGHDGLIRLAANERDSVHVFAANSSNRDFVRAETMHEIWDQHIIPALPKGTWVHFTNNPVRSVYEHLGRYNEDPCCDSSFVIYGDPTDVISNFPDRSLEKYVGNLFRADRVSRRPVERSSTMDVSGTRMREWLREGDERSFCAHLPAWMNKRTVWQLLRRDAMNRP